MKHFINAGILTATAILLLNPAVRAQDDGLKHCGQLEAVTRLHTEHPEILQHELQVQQQQAALPKTIYQKTAAAPNYTIPIVFHVMHQYGTENVSDAQIIDAVRILNEDYQLRNADTSQIVPAFKGIKADVGLEFRLAKLDPNGNCTNGIIHTYTPLTVAADDQVKFDQWDPAKYLNVWLVKSIGLSGAAGYAYYPSSADANPSIDGVLILSNYVGSIGTGSYFTGRALTHEIGHYLNLQHTWGNTNNPGVACGDDGINDTPITKGWTNCIPTGNICNPGTVENVQNYMEYAYCSKMFTEDQKQAMLAALNSPVANRNNLWTMSNLLATGTDDAAFTSTVGCKPVADFYYSSKSTCVNNNLTFSDLSYNGTPTTWKWDFPGGSPSTSTQQNPVVSYSATGTYTVKLKVTNSQGQDSITKNSVISIYPIVANMSPPLVEGFENIVLPNSNWQVVSGNDNVDWQIAPFGASGSRSAEINNFITGKGDVDELISPPLNMSSTVNGFITFKVAYACTDTSTNKDVLRLLVSKDCGATWAQRYSKSAKILSTNTGGGDVTTMFTPTSSEWRMETVILPPSYMGSNTMLKFQFTGGGGNNVYIDDININLTTGIEDLSLNNATINLFPNPFDASTTLQIDAQHDATMNLDIVDVLGKVVRNESKLSIHAGTNTFQIERQGLSKGIYFLNLSMGSQHITQKMIIQ